MPKTGVRLGETEQGCAVRWLRRGLAPLLLVTASGCYSYIAISPETAAPGAQVRAQLSEAPVAAPGGFGLARQDVMEGQVVERHNESLVLAVFPRDAGAQQWAHGARDTVALRLNQIQALEQKRLSTARTAGLVAGVGVVGALVVRYLFGSWTGGSGRTPGGGPAEVRLAR